MSSAGDSSTTYLIAGIAAAFVVMLIGTILVVRKRLNRAYTVLRNRT